MELRDIKQFFNEQLKTWGIVAKNFEALEFVEKKPMEAGNLKGFVQFNPARVISTMVKLDPSSLSSRKCFLCKENRPAEQKSIELLKRWELLVNPYPILPYHFTIASKNHEPQVLHLESGIQLAKELKGMAVFFNADGAGASAPDHLHFQAVPIEQIPLVSLINKEKESSLNVLNLPFKIERNSEKIAGCPFPMNVFFWQKENENIEVVAIPRKAHRPDCYFKLPPERRAVSPGALDMAGVIVTPFKEDYEAINNQDIQEIYRQVAFVNE